MAFEDKVRDFYNSRRDYDNLTTISRATALVNLFPPMVGATVFDLATGTGNVAFRAAEIVGPTGKVLGLDIAEELLRIAASKRDSIFETYVEFRNADIGMEVFPKGTIDSFYCSFAIMLVANIDLVLGRIAAALAPGSFFAFTSASSNSYLNDEIVRAGALSGITIPPSNERFGNRERILSRLEKAGLRADSIVELQYGRFLELNAAKAKWDGKFWIHPEQTLDSIDEEVSKQMKFDFDRIVEREARDGYVWFEEKVYYIKAVRAG